MPAFDALETSRQLRAAGLAETQADAIASAIAHGVRARPATKTDLALFEERLRSHTLKLALALGAFLAAFVAAVVGIATAVILQAL